MPDPVQNRKTGESVAAPGAARSVSAASVASDAGASVCPRCGGRTLRSLSRPGRTIRYRNLSAAPVPDDVLIPTCVRCRAEFIDAELLKLIHERLQEPYQRSLQLRVRRAIDTLTQHTSQRRLEVLLGLSQGYLSRLRAGGGNPSVELVSNLALLAMDPKRRLHELERYWAEPIATASSGRDKDKEPRPTSGLSSAAADAETPAASLPFDDDEPRPV